MIPLITDVVQHLCLPSLYYKTLYSRSEFRIAKFLSVCYQKSVNVPNILMKNGKFT
jgi:hypothetical protein